MRVLFGPGASGRVVPWVGVIGVLRFGWVGRFTEGVECYVVDYLPNQRSSVSSYFKF